VRSEVAAIRPSIFAIAASSSFASKRVSLAAFSAWYSSAWWRSTRFLA